MRSTTIDMRRAEIESRRTRRAPFLEGLGSVGAPVALGGALGFFIGAMLFLPVVEPVTVFEAFACVLVCLGGAAGGWFTAQSADGPRCADAHAEKIRACEVALRRVRASMLSAEKRVVAETFALDELEYRPGFEAAMDVFVRGKSRSDVFSNLASRAPEILDSRRFRFGYERGEKYAEERRRSSCADSLRDGASGSRPS